VTFADGKTAIYEKVLVTIGRTPNSDGIGLEKAGVKLDAKGFIGSMPQRKSNVPTIYAIGDIAGQPLLAHKGSKEECGRRGHRGKEDEVRRARHAAVIFTDPEIATVGLTEAEAKAKVSPSDRHLSIRRERPGAFRERTRWNGEDDRRREDRTPAGSPYRRAEASNLIAEADARGGDGAQVEDLALTVHAHPTLPETMMEAAERTLGHAIHIFQKKPSAGASPSAHA